MKKTKNKTQKPINIKKLGGDLLLKMVRTGAKVLGKNADTVNKLNVFPVPDGDTGDNMRMTIESGIAALENVESDDLAEVMKILSHGMLLGARGNSGVILSQFFAGMAKGLEDSKKADPKTLGKAMELGVKQAYSSVMTPTEGTILTVARESVEYAVSNINEESTIRTLFADLVKEMHASLDRTPQILAVLKEAGVVDSGGAGLLYIMEGFNRVLNGERVEEESNNKIQTPNTKKPTDIAFDADSKMTFSYCTEVLVQLLNSKTDVKTFGIDSLKNFLCSIGDSVVAVKSDTVVKVHVHTFEPEKVLEYCRKYGEFISVKIENMSLQHTELEGNVSSDTTVSERKKYGVVAVVNGDGISELYTSLGTDVIIDGGQTNNPSTNDFIEAFASVNADNILVFPNNSNVFLAASQAAAMYEGAAVHVIKSYNIGAGFAALSSADLECEDVDLVISGMYDAMKAVLYGYVSPAVRDADINGIHIGEGDIIGIIEKEIIASEKNILEASVKTVDMMLAYPEKTLLTVFCGKGVNDENNESLEQSIVSRHPNTEIVLVDGKQDIYPYIFIAE